MEKQNTSNLTKPWYREMFEGTNGTISSKRVFAAYIIVPIVLCSVAGMIVTMIKEIHLDWLLPILLELVPAGVTLGGLGVVEKNHKKDVKESIE